MVQEVQEAEEEEELTITKEMDLMVVTDLLEVEGAVMVIRPVVDVILLVMVAMALVV